MTTPRLTPRLLRPEDTFALFDVRLYLNGVWPTAHISHLPPLKGHRDGLRHLFDEWARMERWAYLDGVVGWTCATDEDNTRMQRWFHAVGARPFHRERTREGAIVYFHKSLMKDPTTAARTLRRLVWEQQSHLHGRAAHG